LASDKGVGIGLFDILTIGQRLGIGYRLKDVPLLAVFSIF